MIKTISSYVVAALVLACECKAQVVAQELSDGRKPKIMTYAEIRKEVAVKKLTKKPDWDKPRPANFFQLAGSANTDLCEATLAAFNERGEKPLQYHWLSSGVDEVHWLLGNSHEVRFQSLEPGKPLYSFTGLEYARVDLDGDGMPEHVYRRNIVLGSYLMQELLIASDPLQERIDLLKKYEAECQRINPRDSCGEKNNQISYAFSASYPEKLSVEWAFTRMGAISHTLQDKASQGLTRVRVDKHYEDTRNVGHSNVYWSLYDIESTVVVVSAPILDFSPPELFVFLPSKDQPGILQCILMPKAWHKFVKLNR